jgi:hypothetical protein
MDTREMKRVLRRALWKRSAQRSESARRIGLREIRADDTFIVSFPKSGNTWVRFLIACMQHPEEEVSFRNIERFVPDIHKSRRLIQSMPPPRFVKCHTPCFDAFPRFVYVVRDGRDAMISFYHYAVGARSFTGSLGEFLVSAVATRYGTWSDHVLAALEVVERHPERALMVRYEDLLSSAVDQAHRIAVFCRMSVRPEAVEGAVADCRFSRLQEIERRYGGELDDGADFRFFRRGVSGQWRNEATERELAPFLEEARYAMARLGYLK